MQLSIYLRGAMMSFVSGYYGADSTLQCTGARVHPWLHFTRHGISQIHERRTVSRAVVKFPWNFDRNYPPPLCTRVTFLSFFFVRSTRIYGSSRWNYRLLRGILDFSPWASGCILNPYPAGTLASLSNGHFITAILLGTCITYGTVDTTFRGDWIVIDCGIIPER